MKDRLCPSKKRDGCKLNQWRIVFVLQRNGMVAKPTKDTGWLQIWACSFCLVPLVLENCEPFAPTPENQEKCEPFQTNTQKCEPFASLCQKRIPKVRTLSRFRRARAQKCEPFASFRRKREPFLWFARMCKAMPKPRTLSLKFAPKVLRHTMEQKFELLY